MSSEGNPSVMEIVRAFNTIKGVKQPRIPRAQGFPQDTLMEGAGYHSSQVPGGVGSPEEAAGFRSQPEGKPRVMEIVRAFNTSKGVKQPRIPRAQGFPQDTPMEGTGYHSSQVPGGVGSPEEAAEVRSKPEGNPSVMEIVRAFNTSKGVKQPRIPRAQGFPQDTLMEGAGYHSSQVPGGVGTPEEAAGVRSQPATEMDDEYKSILVVNESSDADITLYLYYARDVICWLSYKSKILKPGEQYYYRSKDGFKYKLKAKLKDKRKTKAVLELQDWSEDKLLTVTGSHDVTEGKLVDFPQQKQICLRKLNRDNELSTCGEGRNFYEILKLDIDKVRKLPPDQQNRTIKKAYLKEILRWHPDHNFGDDEIAREIIMAYSVLGNPEARARYNNLCDYDSGWLSLKRFKAILCPECNSKEQKRAYRNRMGLMLLSGLLMVGGVVATGVSAGAAAPALVAAGAVGGSGFFGAGLQSLPQTYNREAIADGCSTKKWAAKAAIGLMGGAATGGAAVGIAAGITGIGSAAVEAASATVGQYIGVGAATGTAGGAISALASDAGRKFVDGQEVTWKQALFHAVSGGAVGATAGLLGGAVTSAVVASQTSAATANLQGEIGEQVAILTGARRLGNALARTLPRTLTENGTEVVMGSATQFVEERADDSRENRSPCDHLKKGVQNLAVSAFKNTATICAASAATHAVNEIKVEKRMKMEKKTPSTDIAGDESSPSNRSRVRQVMFEEENEHLTNWKKVSSSATYTPPDKRNGFEQDSTLTTTQSTHLERWTEEDEDVTDSLQDGHVKYISKGFYCTKMVVTYNLDSEQKTEEVQGSGKFVDIPSRARKIEVRFKVRRPFWRDILKYDRFRKRWCKPYTSHVFMYDVPPVRTFTISGGTPDFVAVMKVTDGFHDEMHDM